MLNDDDFFCIEILSTLRFLICCLIFLVFFFIFLKICRMRLRNEFSVKVKTFKRFYRCPGCKANIKFTKQQFIQTTKKESFFKRAGAALQSLRSKESQDKTENEMEKCQDKTENEGFEKYQISTENEKDEKFVDNTENKVDEKYQNLKTEKEGNLQTVPHSNVFISDGDGPSGEKVYSMPAGSPQDVTYVAVVPKAAKSHYLIKAKFAHGPTVTAGGVIKMPKDKVTGASNSIILTGPGKQFEAIFGDNPKKKIPEKVMDEIAKTFQETPEYKMITEMTHKAKNMPKEMIEALRNASNAAWEKEDQQMGEEFSAKKATENIKKETGDLTNVLVLK